jgi:hypothetical protein
MSSSSGLGTGIAQSAVFIALQASINPADKAAATSALFLMTPIGTIVGMAMSSALMIGALRRTLFERLVDLGFGFDYIQEVNMVPSCRSEFAWMLTKHFQVIRGAVAGVNYIDEAPPQIANAVVQSYIDGIEYSHCKVSPIKSVYTMRLLTPTTDASLAFSILAFVAAMLLTEKYLRK